MRMDLEAEVDAEPDTVNRITAVARQRSCPAFLDLWWDPAPPPLAVLGDPGVMFESPRRVVVFQRIGGELRYYAGGWCPDEDHIHLEQERVWAEGGESGVFGSVADALAFAELYLVEERSFAAVRVPRAVRYSPYPQIAEAEPGTAAGGA
jgi:hypothetical protein